MADSTPTTGDRTVIVHQHSALTYISLAFNALILLLILIGIVCHSHERHERGDGGGRFDHHQFADRDGGGRFGQHGFGRMHEGWKHQEDGGCGGACPQDGGNRFGGRDGGDRHGFGKDEHRDGGPGNFGGMDHGPKTPPSAETMTDRFMLMLGEKLKLTDQENTQIRPIVQQGITQFQKDMETQKQAHQKMIDDAKAKVRAVLTPDQQKQFDAMTARLGDGAPPPPAPDGK